MPVGKIVRAHGIRGAVKVFAYGETLGVLGAGACLVLRYAASDSESTLTSIEVKPQGRHWLMRFEGLQDLDAVQALVGGELYLPENALPPLEDGEYYHYQLIGLRVFTTQGQLVGELKSILEAGSHDVYVVVRQGGETLIPAVEEIVREVDLEGCRMVIDPPKGLIDDL